VPHLQLVVEVEPNLELGVEVGWKVQKNHLIENQYFSSYCLWVLTHHC
jgi:hypothetical protein